MRYLLMLPRAARLWAMFVAYATLLAAVYFGQSASRFGGGGGGDRGDAGGGDGDGGIGGGEL